ncbi:MAG TPA: T9SS type A sorting domain-containing protein [Ignavibacteriales bacterium]|nr:T9SS type A sorting domain-containing protein [Ignavibacteriales bacterium]
MRKIWIIVLFYLIFYWNTFAQTPHWQEFSHTRLFNVTYFTPDLAGNLYARNRFKDLIRSTTVISYSIPTASNVELKIYDIPGKEVATLVNTFQSAGNYNLNFDAGRLSTGIYFYRIIAGRFSYVKKFILLK